MAGISSYVGVIVSSAYKIQDKILETTSIAQGISNSWEGEDQNAFQEAYLELNKTVSNINGKYRGIDCKISSLQSSTIMINITVKSE